jgi:AraC-like DNA-binding protein
MKPYLEHIATSQESSWTLFDRRLPAIPFEWHYNSEYELTLTLNSRGQRFVGDSIASYDDGDLVLIGPKVPHTWCSNEDIRPEQAHQALVLWFSQGFVQSMIQPHVELRPILRLLDRSSRAIAFSPSVRTEARSIITAMLEQSASERLPSLLRALLILSADADAEPLTSTALQPETTAEATEEHIARVLAYLNKRYREQPEVADLAKLAALSRSSLYRLFKQHTGMTISDYITQLRIGHACALLLNTDLPIAFIADDVGYCNLANFNRQFKALKRQTPRQFRRAFSQREIEGEQPARRPNSSVNKTS